MQSYQNQNDYSFMWWQESIKNDASVFAIKTSQYAMAFDFAVPELKNFIINKRSTSEELVLRETNAESFPENLLWDLDFGISVEGEMSWCDSSTEVDDNCQLIETGQYFQRRFLNNLPALKGCDPYASGLVISSWPDRLAFIVKATANNDLNRVGLKTHLRFPEKYEVLFEQGDARALMDPEDGSGFIILKSAGADSISVENNRVKVEMAPRSYVKAGEELNAGLIIYPVKSGVESRLKVIADQENHPLMVTAEQIAPLAKPLDVAYDRDKGWHRVRLRNDATSSEAPVADPDEGNLGPRSHQLNNRIERVRFSVENPSAHEKVLRLNFAKGRLAEGGGDVFGVSGISAVLRDLDGNPTGIPVQLSKNWHSGGRTGVERHYFRGSWYHGLTLLTVPPKSYLDLEYTSVNSLWGGVSAASHAQLCLVGWGSNQQWDESAIGAWGESITYEPDLDQASAPLLDFRPLLLLSPTGKKWGWTGNMGGADFFNYTKPDGRRAWHSRMRTQYKRYSPNLTEVTYAGTMGNGAMDFEYTVSVGRSNDMTRGIYKIKLRVLDEVKFKDFVVFQAAAETYHFAASHTLAWGDERGLKKEWDATIGGKSRYITDKRVAEGEVPWFSFTDSEIAKRQSDHFRVANRGFVIRDWNAKINGQDDTPPWFAEYNTSSGNHGNPSSLINIIPPDGCNSFQAGDYIEAEIELFLIPKSAEDYYGPNQNFAKALSQNGNTWKMVYREAVGNNIDVAVTRGNLMDAYPIAIEAYNNQARFAVTGGLGYVPLTISGVKDYRNPALFRKTDGTWKKVDQSVYGKDFWQTEYNAATGTWDITYNVNLDTPGDGKEMVDFRFVSDPSECQDEIKD